MFEQLLSPHVGDWYRKMESGLAASKARNFNKALTMFEQCINIAIQHCMSNQAVLQSYVLYANSLRVGGQGAQSEKILRIAIKYSTKNRMQNSAMHMYLLCELGQLFFYRTDFEKCCPVLEKCIDHLNRKKFKTSREALVLFVALTLSYLNLEEWEKAKRIGRTAYDECCKRFGPGNEHTLYAKKLYDQAVLKSSPEGSDVHLIVDKMLPLSIFNP